MDTYLLAQKDILEKLSRDETWFSNCVQQNYERFARDYQFVLKTSQLRLAEAFALWHQDMDRTLSHGIEESVELDPYKRAGFLAYWLRRRIVINEIELYSEAGDPHAPKLAAHKHTLPAIQNRLFNFYNEICAFRFGLDISIYYATNAYCNQLIAQGQSESNVQLMRKEHIRKISEKAKALVVDVSVLMKQKNLSPHALYIIYKGLVSV